MDFKAINFAMGFQQFVPQFQTKHLSTERTYKVMVLKIAPIEVKQV